MIQVTELFREDASTAERITTAQAFAIFSACGQIRKLSPAGNAGLEKSRMTWQM
jgi:hypothetical protein